MAGIAIMSLLNTNGLLATAIACAAFCIPISIMSVRCSFRLRRMDFDSTTPPPIASRIRMEMQSPSLPNWPVMVAWCCMKKMVASRISAGKAVLDNIL